MGSAPGPAATNWRGGRRINNGYVVIWLAKRTYNLEHRVVMERIVGRKLLRTEQVHHKNGNKADNRPENLELLTISKHRSLHNRKELATLTVDKVIEIRNLYASEAFNQYQLADKFGVKQQTISRIVNRKRWADI